MPTTLAVPEIISTRQAAELLGTTPESLRSMRSQRENGPPYHKIEGVQSVLYLRREVLDYIEERDAKRARRAKRTQPA